MKFLILIFIHFVFLQGFCQQSFIFNGNKYKTTREWRFNYRFLNEGESEVKYGTLYGQIAKTLTGGILIIGLEADISVLLKGPLYINLKNNKTLTCIERNKRFHENNRSYSMFYLSASEMIFLRESSILSISFNRYSELYKPNSTRFNAFNDGYNYKSDGITLQVLFDYTSIDVERLYSDE